MTLRRELRHETLDGAGWATLHAPALSSAFRAPRKIRGARAGQDAPPFLKRLSA
jgi:hypothetical protein